MPMSGRISAAEASHSAAVAADWTYVTYVDLPASGEPSADVDASSVLDALLRGGRWADAADYCLAVDEAEIDQGKQIALLLAAGRTDEAHVLLASRPMDTDEASPWSQFLRCADVVMQGSTHALPDLIRYSEHVAPALLVPLVMLRAADRAGRPDVAAHYAKQVLQFNPGDVNATRVACIDLLNCGEYVAAVNLLDRAEALRCTDEASVIGDFLDRLASNKEQLSALATIGRYMHREHDPTVPITDVEREARLRWRLAYRTHGNRYWSRRLAWLATGALALASFFVIGNGLPGLAIAVGFGAWLRTRPLPGLDLRTSKLVRAVSDPRTIILARRYQAFDVFTFVFTAVIAGGLAATYLSNGPGWLAAPLTIAVLFLAAAATRGRRRWIRYQRLQAQRPPYDATICSCLGTAGMQGAQSRGYVQEHLFQAGAVSLRPAWKILQCLDTHVRFLDVPQAQLTIRLATSHPADPAS
jgi:hypothetical protein